MKAFLFTHNNQLGPDFVKWVLDSTNAVTTWVSPYQGAAIILSNLTVSELAAVLHTHLGEFWFVVVELTPQNSNGWLPGTFWEYVSDPYNSWTKKLLADISTLQQQNRLPKGKS